MQNLIDGIQTFQKDVYPEHKARFEELASGQQPQTLLITCSDSRISPSLVTQTLPGEVFVLRTAGNIVPPYGSVFSGEAATIEYAVAVLKIPHIVVCGHSRCGAMDALLNLETVQELPAVAAYLKHAESTLSAVNENFKDVSDPAEKLNVAIEQNVLMQLQNLKTHPAVQTAIEQGALQLHGSVYHFESGVVTVYDEATQKFVEV